VPGVGPALYEPAGDGLDRRLAIHTPDTDLFLDTNLPREELLAISSSLGVRARVPASWRRSRSGGLVVERVSPSLALEQLDLTTVRSALPAGYVAASAARTIAQGKTIGVTVTFRRLDTDAAGSALTLHRGTADANDDLEPNAVRVALGSADGLYTPATSSLSWADGGRSWWLQGDVDLSSLVEIATAVRRHAS
jgi:hypothetical protein